MRRARAVGLLVAAALATPACRNDWRTDMWYQPSIRPEAAPRPEPERSVPLGAGPRYESRDDTEQLANPIPASPRVLERGHALFLARCAPCHGPDGRGGGPVSRFFPPAPDLAYVKVRERTDGFIWGTVGYGGKAMPPAREGLTAADRWAIVDWVREIQRTSPVVTVPPAPPVPPEPSGGAGKP
jgi:mono/diheme cytochrome c family protein